MFKDHVRIHMYDASSLDFCNITFSRGLAVFVMSNVVGVLRFAGVVGLFITIDARGLGPVVPVIEWERRRPGAGRCPIVIRD